MTTVDL